MIIFFSGTGNSEYVAQRLGELTGQEVLDLFDRIRESNAAAAGTYGVAGVDDMAAPAGASNADPLSSEDPWVVVAPVYAWKLPRLVEEYLAKTELAGSNEIYYVLTCGDGVAGAGRYAEELSRKIGKTYKGLAPVVMPENYIAMFPVPNSEESMQIIQDAEEIIQELADCIKSRKNFSAKPGSRFMSSVINWGFYNFALKDKKFTAGDKCNGCGLCEKVCPLNNVAVENGKPAWKGNCTHCMRCICMCPQEAIEYGKASVGKWRYQCPALKK